jgi:hypothetical protein
LKGASAIEQKACGFFIFGDGLLRNNRQRELSASEASFVYMV